MFLKSEYVTNYVHACYTCCEGQKREEIHLTERISSRF